MSVLARLLARLGRLSAARRRPVDPESLSLRDWADLPPYHPGCDPGGAGPVNPR